MITLISILWLLRSLTEFLGPFHFSVQASVTSSSETRKSKTVIRIEKEKIYLHLNGFTSKVGITLWMLHLKYLDLIDCCTSYFLIIIVGSHYDSPESYGYGKWSGGCPDDWKRPSIQWIAIAFDRGIDWSTLLIILFFLCLIKLQWTS